MDGGGEMGALMRAFDWRGTPLGPPAQWPQALRTALRLLLNSGHPMYIFWGPQGTCFYNDAYRPSIGSERHPGSLGKTARAVWDEIWPIIGPQIEQVMQGGGATWHEDQLVPTTRNGVLEDIYWTYSYSPIDDATAASGVGGVLVVCTETTGKVLARQQLAHEMQRQRRLFKAAPGFIAVMHGPQHVFEFVNDAYIRIAGTREYLGRSVREVFPELAGQGLFERLDQVFATGERQVARQLPLRLLQGTGGAMAERYLDFIYEAVRDDAGRIIGVFIEGHDVTESTRAQQRLGTQAKRNEFLAQLSEKLLGVADARKAMCTAAEMLGRHLGVDSAGYAEFSNAGDDLVNTTDWISGEVPDPLSFHCGKNFGWLTSEFRAGRSGRYDDGLLELLAAADGSTGHVSTGMRSAILVPLLRSGQLTAVLYVQRREPYTWSDDDEAFIREVAERVWSAVERARAAEALRNSQSYLQLALDASRFGFWTLHVGRDSAERTPRHDAIFGYSEPLPQWGYADFIRHVHEEDRDAVNASFQKAVEEGLSWRLDCRIRRAGDGRIRWIEAQGQPVLDADGKAAIFSGVVADVTDRKAADDAVKEGEERFQAIADSIDHMVWSTLPDGFHDYYNQRWYDYTGVPAGSTDGEAWNGMFHPEDQPRAWEVWRKSLASGEPYYIEYRLRHRSGQYRWVLGRAQPVRDAWGRITRWFGTCTDIQEIVEARNVLARSATEMEQLIDERTVELEHVNEALRVNEARMRSIFETTHLYQGFLSVGGTLIDANAASLKGIAARLEDVVGQPFWNTPWFSATPGAPQVVQQAMVKALKGDHVSQLLAINIVAGLRTFDFSMRPVRNHEGEVVGIVPEALDVTSRLQAEEALRHAQKMEAVGQLTGGIAHDFNNLLQAVTGGLEILGRKYIHSEDGQKVVRLVNRAANRGAHLTQQLLAFSRKQTLDARALDANAAIIAAMELATRSLGPSVTLEKSLTDTVWPVFADPNQLDVALLNLMINARDAMPEGGVITGITGNVSAPAAGVPGDLAAGDYVRVAIADQGMGMSEEVLARVYEPFFTTKGIGKGTGLGLSQVYGFAHQSGGTVRILSTLGKGTTVEIFLPRASSEEADAEPELDGRAWQGRETILVIDDDPDVRELTTTCLDELGYRVHAAAGGREGLEILARHSDIELLLVDYAMPEMTGAEVVRMARQQNPKLEVLFMSGYADLEVMSAHVKGDSVIQKPFRLALLAERVGLILARRSAR